MMDETNDRPVDRIDPADDELIFDILEAMEDEGKRWKLFPGSPQRVATITRVPLMKDVVVPASLETVNIKQEVVHGTPEEIRKKFELMVKCYCAAEMLRVVRKYERRKK